VSARALLATALIALALPAGAQQAAAAWKVDPAKSAIVFRSTYAGTPVMGRFARWTAAISFDPAKLAEAKVVVDVDLASASTGDRTVDPQLPTADWFNTGAFPRARFTSTSVVQTGGGRYLAKGSLAMRGVSVPVELPFTLTINGDSAQMAGTAKLDRRAFKLGMASDASGEWVAFAVPLEIRVTASRAR